MTALQVVWPDAVHDPLRPSGGNVYDRELVSALASRGVGVEEHLVAAPHRLAGVLASLPDGAVVLVDGLVGLAAPDALEAQRGRIVQVVLVHQPLALAHAHAPSVEARESRALAAADAVVTTSEFTRRWLSSRYAIRPSRVAVAIPGVRPAALTYPAPGGHRLLCVGPVTRAKGQDVLVEALARLRRPGWRCRLVGSADLDPTFAHGLRARSEREALRVRFDGVLTRTEMDAAYAETDLLVVPSRCETYGMVVTEALARGIPVLAADSGGVPEALGPVRADRPGVLVPPGDVRALGAALTRWLADPHHRDRLRMRARDAAPTLPRWSATADAVLSALSGLSVNLREAAPVVRA